MNPDRLMPEDVPGFLYEEPAIYHKCCRCKQHCELVEDKGWEAFKLSKCCNAAYYDTEEAPVEPPALEDDEELRPVIAVAMDPKQTTDRRFHALQAIYTKGLLNGIDLAANCGRPLAGSKTGTQG